MVKEDLGVAVEVVIELDKLVEFHEDAYKVIKEDVQIDGQRYR